MIDVEKATEIAWRTVRFEIGTIPFLDNVRHESDTYTFDIMYSYTEMPTEQNGNEDVIFYEPQKIGELHVSNEEDISYTNTDKLQTNITQIKQQARNGKIDTV